MFIQKLVLELDPPIPQGSQRNRFDRTVVCLDVGKQEHDHRKCI